MSYFYVTKKSKDPPDLNVLFIIQCFTSMFIDCVQHVQSKKLLVRDPWSKVLFNYKMTVLA